MPEEPTAWECPHCGHQWSGDPDEPAIERIVGDGGRRYICLNCSEEVPKPPASVREVEGDA